MKVTETATLSVSLTELARKKLQHDLYMDDCNPMRILALSDNELVTVCCKNYGTDYVCSIDGVKVDGNA